MMETVCVRDESWFHSRRYGFTGTIGLQMVAQQGGRKKHQKTTQQMSCV